MKLKIILMLLPLILLQNLWGKDHFFIKGKYLLFSYDHNYIYGKGEINISFNDISLQGERLHIDLAKKQARLLSNCLISFKDDKKLKADVVLIDLLDYGIDYINYQEKITIKKLNKKSQKPPKTKPSFKQQRLKKLKESLLYFVGTEMIIKKNFNVVGKKVTIFIEGMESIAFKKIKMNRGLSNYQAPFSLAKLWYYDSLGIVSEMRLKLKKQLKKTLLVSDSSLKLNYDLFDTRSYGSQSYFFLDIKNSIIFSPDTRLNLNFNHITENITGGAINFNFKPLKPLTAKINIDYKKPINNREELWFELDTDLYLKKFGTISVNLSYEKENQYKSELSYVNNYFKNLTFSIAQSDSKLFSGNDLYKKLSNSRFSLTYNTKIFNFSANYSLNKDLLRNYSQSNPQINFNFLPFTLYNKLLNINVTASFDINNVDNSGIDTDTFKANIGTVISSKELHLSDTTTIDFSLGIEQLLEKDNTDHTTSGLILKGKQKFFDFADLEIIYNYHTRRESSGWFINGTSSQDLSTILKIYGLKNINMWGSISYNPKSGDFTSSYFDCKLKIIKKWYFQTLLKYDFEFRNFYYDLFLTRQAGRFQIRLTYRSISDQFQIEILTVK